MKNKFSQRLAKLRKKSGMSQKIAAQKLGISQALLSHYENGIRECGLDFVMKAAKVFDVSCDYLLGACDRLPDESADSDIYEKLSKKPRLYQARNNLQSAIDLLYSISVRFGNSKLQSELNNLLYSDIYSALALICGNDAESENQILSYPLPKSLIKANAKRAAAEEKFSESVNSAEIRLSEDMLQNEYSRHLSAVRNIVETVESRKAEKNEQNNLA